MEVGWCYFSLLRSVYFSLMFRSFVFRPWSEGNRSWATEYFLSALSDRRPNSGSLLRNDEGFCCEPVFFPLGFGIIFLGFLSIQVSSVYLWIFCVERGCLIGHASCWWLWCYCGTTIPGDQRLTRCPESYRGRAHAWTYLTKSLNRCLGDFRWGSLAHFITRWRLGRWSDWISHVPLAVA